MTGIRGAGGIPRILANLDECLATCTRESECLAIDWEESKKTCWMISPYNTIPTTQSGVITHYDLERQCRG